MVAPVQFRVTVNDEDVTDRIMPFLQSISITDNNGEQSDSLTIQVAAKFRRPSYNDKIKIWVGRTQPLAYLGQFHVQSTTLRDNRILTIDATGVDYQSGLKERRSVTYKTSLRDALTTVSQRHGLALKLDVQEPFTAHFEQNNESDVAFLNRLATTYNAIFNIKNHTLYFVQNETHAPAYEIDIAECFSSVITESNTSWYACARAIYQDTKLNQLATVNVGSGTPVLIVRGNWLCTEDAQEAAAQALARANGAQVYGRASFKGRPMFAGGLIKIDGGEYQLKTVTHRIQPTWVTEIEFQSRKEN